MLEAEAYKRGFVPTEATAFATAAAWPDVLDLYAGSGALAIEALSRGAKQAALVESDAEARRAIQEKLRRTGLADRARVYALPVEQALERLTGRYGLVFMDPPYGDPRTLEVLQRLPAAGRVGPESVIVLEHGPDLVPPPRLDGFRLARTRRYGRTCITLYTGSAEPDRPAAEG